MPYKDPELQKQAKREWYEKNRDTTIQRARTSRVKRRKQLAELKDQPCADCKLSWPSCVMEFHHRDPATKSFTVSRLLTDRSWAAILEEVAKCDLLCANCHRIREMNERANRG